MSNTEKLVAVAVEAVAKALPGMVDTAIQEAPKAIVGVVQEGSRCAFDLFRHWGNEAEYYRQEKAEYFNDLNIRRAVEYGTVAKRNADTYLKRVERGDSLDDKSEYYHYLNLRRGVEYVSVAKRNADTYAQQHPEVETEVDKLTVLLDELREVQKVEVVR